MRTTSLVLNLAVVLLASSGLHAACPKAVFFDLAGLTGIWRPLSFLVLGVVLIGIGMVYQRLLFAPRPAAPPAEPAAPA